jgi:hypothetical protein
MAVIEGHEIEAFEPPEGAPPALTSAYWAGRGFIEPESAKLSWDNACELFAEAFPEATGNRDMPNLADGSRAVRRVDSDEPLVLLVMFSQACWGAGFFRASLVAGIYSHSEGCVFDYIGSRVVARLSPNDLFAAVTNRLRGVA